MNHDAINQRIQTLESELAELKEELSKPKKFEFKYTAASATRIHQDHVEGRCSILPSAQENFRYRQTETNALADFQLQKELMCIGALAEQIDPDYKSKVVWGDTNNWMVYYSLENKKYKTTNNISMKFLGVVYMPKDVAKKVCEILNNKQVEL